MAHATHDDAPYVTIFQEAHINNILQCFIDNDVSGMDYMHLQDARFRPPMPAPPTCQGGAESCQGSQCRSTGSLASPSYDYYSPSSTPGVMELNSVTSLSPFIGRNEHKLWWADNTDPDLVSSFGSAMLNSGGRKSSESDEIETASQVLMGFGASDLELSQNIYGGNQTPRAPIENVARPLSDDAGSPLGYVKNGGDRPAFLEEEVSRPPDHQSRSRSELELDTSAHHIMNRRMRVKAAQEKED